MPGKTVNSFDEIAMSDIPMDGSVAVFVGSNLSEIQTRSWASDGTIRKTVFKPILNSEANNSTLNATESVVGVNLDVTDIYSRLDRIEKLIKENHYEHKSNGTDESDE